MPDRYPNPSRDFATEEAEARAETRAISHQLARSAVITIQKPNLSPADIRNSADLLNRYIAQQEQLTAPGQILSRNEQNTAWQSQTAPSLASAKLARAILEPALTAFLQSAGIARFGRGHEIAYSDDVYAKLGIALDNWLAARSIGGNKL